MKIPPSQSTPRSSVVLEETRRVHQLGMPATSKTEIRPLTKWRFSPLQIFGWMGLIGGVRGQPFPAVMKLGELTSSDGFVLNHYTSYDYGQVYGCGAGDLNQDGVDDLFTSSPFNGKTAVLFGKRGLRYEQAVQVSQLNGSNGFLIEEDAVGITSIACPGDLNDDDIPDLLICGTLRSDIGGFKGWVLFGHATLGAGGSITLTALNGSNGFTLESSERWLIDATVSGVGDLNNDGIADFAIGSYSNLLGYVVFGGKNVDSDGTLDLDALNGTNGLQIRPQADRYGLGLEPAGDVNGDTIADLIVSVRNSRGLRSRTTAVVFGSPNLGINGTFEMSKLKEPNGFLIVGASKNTYALLTRRIGDVNEDGVDDLVVGDPLVGTVGTSYVIFGHRDLGANGRIDVRALNQTQGFSIRGVNAKDYSGEHVGSAGDLNGDTIADLLISSRGTDLSINHYDAGRTYILFGRPNLGVENSLPLSAINGMIGFSLTGEEIEYNTGQTGEGIGDLNGDGIEDLFLGMIAQGDDLDPQNYTRGFVIFGRRAGGVATAPSKESISSLGTTTDNRRTGTTSLWQTSSVPSTESISSSGTTTEHLRTATTRLRQVSSVALKRTDTATQGSTASLVGNTATWSTVVSSTRDSVSRATTSTDGPGEIVIALMVTVIGLVLSMCGAAGLFLRRQWKGQKREAPAAEEEGIYSVPPPNPEEPIYQELELREDDFAEYASARVEASRHSDHYQAGLPPPKSIPDVYDSWRVIEEENAHWERQEQYDDTANL